MYFSKISTDQTIEQTLMKSMKIELVLSVFEWVRATLFTTDVLDGMEEFCGVSFKSSYQHIGASDRRLNEASKAVDKIADFFKIHNPFPNLQKVRAISTGVVGNETINCYKAFDIGTNLGKKMKASERNRRYISNISIDYLFEEDMPLNTTKEKFLANRKNKHRFINLLCKKTSRK